MARKLAMVVFTHDCDEDPCHLKNDVQESWIRENIDLNQKLRWNWRLYSVRVVDLKGDEPPFSQFATDTLGG